MDPRSRARFVYWYGVWTVISYALFLVLVVAQGYVRWKINQNFSFLPGAGFETLAAVVFGQLLGLVYVVSRER